MLITHQDARKVKILDHILHWNKYFTSTTDTYISDPQKADNLSFMHVNFLTFFK